MPAYDVLFIKKPTIQAMEGGAEEEILAGPFTVMAKGTESAAVNAGKLATKELADIPNAQVEVLVRTFQG